MGRPSFFTEDRRRTVIRALRVGHSRRAAAAAGSPWREFAEEVDRAEQAAEDEMESLPAGRNAIRVTLSMPDLPRYRPRHIDSVRGGAG